MGEQEKTRCIILELATPLADVKAACAAVFDCEPPLSLFGVPVQIVKDYYRISAVDLDSRLKLDFEILPDLLRCYYREDEWEQADMEGKTQQVKAKLEEVTTDE